MADEPTPRLGSGALRRAGLASWSALGIIALLAVVAAALSAVSAILTPLVVAVIVAIVLEPPVEALKRRKVPAGLAAAVVLLVAGTLVAGSIVVVVIGFVEQWPEIYRQLILGWQAFLRWGASLDLDTQWLDRGRVMFESHSAQLGQGVLGAITGTFFGAVSLIMGVFFAAFFLFFALRDAARFPAWLSRTELFDADEVEEVVSLSRQSILGYFRGTAITALLTAPIFMVPLLLLGVPLAIPIFLVYFLFSFVPFLGAWITGALAILIAFGSGGPVAALILGVAFLISNGAIQAAVNSWALGSSLQLHPVAVLLATMIGGTVAGVLGMVLGAPVLAATAKSVAAIRRLRATTPQNGGDS